MREFALVAVLALGCTGPATAGFDNGNGFSPGYAEVGVAVGRVRLAQSSLAVIEAPQQIDTDRETVDVAGRVMVPGAATLTIDGDPVPVAADGSFRVRRRVPVGPSRLTLVLEGSYGDKAEHKVLVRRTAAVGATLDFGTFHALVIGNNNYDHLDDLETGRADAEAVAALLSGLYGFEVEILIDATRADIISALARKRAQLTERDNLLIYYAGHGKLDVRSDEGYWLPTDAESDNPVNWISNTTVSAQLRAMSAKHVMVVADSCYTGRLTRSAETVLKTGAERTVWLKNTNARRSRTVLTSGGLAPVANGGTHSVFAQAFLTALQMSEQILDGEALFEAVKPSVTSAANQTLEYSDIRKAGHDGGDFLFVPEPALGPPVAEVPVTGQTPTSPPAGDASIEMLFWQWIQGSNNPAAYDEYLRRYPNGTFARLAELQRDRRGQTQETVAQAAPLPAGEQAADSIELAFWGAIKESESPSDYEAYLTQFPEGTFATLARLRIARIERLEAAEAAEAVRKEAERQAAEEAKRKEAERIAAEEAAEEAARREALREALEAAGPERRAALEQEEMQIAAVMPSSALGPMPPGTDVSTTRTVPSDATEPDTTSDAAIDRNAEDRIVEATFWQAYKDSTDPAVFDRYLRQFPDGATAARLTERCWL